VVSWVGRHWRIILTVSSALAAAVLGAAVQEMLDTKLRLAAASVLVVCVLVIALLAGLAAAIDSRRRADEDIIAAIQMQETGQREIAASTSDRITALAEETRRLSRNIGMKVDTMLLSELNTAKTIDADRTSQLMFSAQEEIRILDLILDDGRWPDEAMDQSYQHNAFDTFLALLRRTDPSIAYKRIIQVTNPATSLKNAQTLSIVKHCHDILDLQRTKGKKVSLRVTRRRFPFKFILIDKDALVLQLEEYGRSGEDLEIWGEVLVSDPGGQLVNVFSNIWDELLDDPSTRTVTLSDLPARPVEPFPDGRVSQ
jgi:hypothetical protein